MARFYAIRHQPTGNLLVKRHVGTGMKYVPAAQGPGDVDYLQHLVTFKAAEVAAAFIYGDLRNICDGQWNQALPEHLEVVPLEVALA